MWIMTSDEDDWNVPYSEDEGDSSKSNEGEKWEIPLHVLLLYSKIEKKGFLEVQVNKECRSGLSTASQDEEDEESNSLHVHPEPETFENEEIRNNTETNKTPKPSAFDYTEENIEDSSLLTRKAPKTERFHRKRVGTLENVISDLKRFREMDNKELESDEKKQTTLQVDGGKN